MFSVSFLFQFLFQRIVEHLPRMSPKVRLDAQNRLSWACVLEYILT